MDRSEDNTAVPTYSKAPITEALIEIQIKEIEGASIKTVGDEIAKDLLNRYPLRSAIRETTFRTHLDPEEPAASLADSMLVGWRFVTNDGRQTANIRANGLAFSQISPYQTWERLREELSLVWTAYRSVVKPVEVVRLGMRYINRLDLPLPFNDFKEYLRSTPELPPELPQLLNQYFFQASVFLQDVTSSLTLSHGLVPPAKAEHASVIQVRD